MNETNRNTRTLIVSFVLVIMVLIPLRFVEVGQTIIDSNQQQVLGETTVAKEILPAAAPTTILEEPYNTIENSVKCISRTDLDSAWADLRTEVENKQVDEAGAEEMIASLVAAEARICK
jgi:hypothetical protein